MNVLCDCMQVGQLGRWIDSQVGLVGQAYYRAVIPDVILFFVRAFGLLIAVRKAKENFNKHDKTGFKNKLPTLTLKHELLETLNCCNNKMVQVDVQVLHLRILISFSQMTNKFCIYPKQIVFVFDKTLLMPIGLRSSFVTEHMQVFSWNNISCVPQKYNLIVSYIRATSENTKPIKDT